MSERREWHNSLAKIGEERGFYRQLGPMHKALYLHGNTTLVVSFDNLDDARQDSADRMPWGSQFISSQGWSSLGIGAHGWTWYRDDAVLDFFDMLRDNKFFDQFENIVFYGTSMGGYAAAAFSAAAPGSRVLTMNPQATLDRNITGGWEKRFRKSWSQNFSGRYGFGPDQVKTAKDVYLFYDSTLQEDAMHAALFRGDNITKIRCRHFGHGLTSMLMKMGVLKQVVAQCVNEDPTPPEIYKVLRARRTTDRYQKTVLRKLEETGRPWFVQNYAQAVVNASHPKRRPHFENAAIRAGDRLKQTS